MSAHDGSPTTGPNYAAAVDGPNYAAAVDGPNYAAAVDGPNYAAAVDGPSGPSLPLAVGDARVRDADDPSEANIESYLRRSFKPVADVA